MKGRPTISTARTVEIYREAISARRSYCNDQEFFKMSDFWRDMCVDDPNWTIREYPGTEKAADKRKAGVTTFAGKLTLIVDSDLMREADKGCLLSNFVLGHEAGHVLLDHHSSDRVVKNFRIFDGPSGNTVRPPTVEELEAHYAAVFFQCGVGLCDGQADAFRLAKRAYTNPFYVRKLRRFLRLDIFERELQRQSRSRGRIIL